MTLSASLKSKTHSVWNLRKNGTEVDVISNGTDLFLTAGVTKFGETGPDVDLCAEDERLSGIIVGRSDAATDMDKDSDDTYANNINLKMGVPTTGEEIFLTAKTAATVVKDQTLQCDGGFFEDTDFAAAESAANVPYAGSMLLASTEAVTGVSGLEIIFLARRV